MTRTGLAIALAALAGCATLRVRTDHDPTVDFARFHTFTIRKGTPAPDPFTQVRIEGAVAAVLAGKGLRQVPSGGDLGVYTHLRVSHEQRITTQTVGYGPWWPSPFGVGPMGGMMPYEAMAPAGVPYGAMAGDDLGDGGYEGFAGPGGALSTTSVEEVPVGRITVDLVDAARRRLVWRGIARDYLSNYPPDDPRPLRSAMEELFAGYPPGPPTAVRRPPPPPARPGTAPPAGAPPAPPAAPPPPPSRPAAGAGSPPG